MSCGDDSRPTSDASPEEQTNRSLVGDDFPFRCTTNYVRFSTICFTILDDFRRLLTILVFLRANDSLEHLAEAVGVPADVGERGGLDQKGHFHGRGGLQVRRLLAKLPHPSKHARQTERTAKHTEARRRKGQNTENRAQQTSLNNVKKNNEEGGVCGDASPHQLSCGTSAHGRYFLSGIFVQ